MTEKQKAWLEKLKKGTGAFNDVPKELLTEEFCLAAVRKSASAPEYFAPALKTEAFCLAAVKLNGMALEFVPDAFKTEAVCLAAVNQNDWALKYVSNAALERCKELVKRNLAKRLRRGYDEFKKFLSENKSS